MTARRFIGDEHDRLKEVEIVQIEWQKDEKGRFVPKEIAGTEKIVPCQLALLAMGFLGPEDQLLEQLGVHRDERTNVKAHHGTYTTSIPCVFAAGDCRRGQSLVVWAFNEGRSAARECDRYLMGYTDLA
jgi:glutamate synthase (NADPH/NADH) small chain